MESNDGECDFKIEIKLGTGECFEASMNVRPGAEECLRQLSKVFEIGVFTASQEAYASRVIEKLDPEGEFIDFCVFREHCVVTADNIHVKDLRIFNRDMSNMTLVDNAAYSYVHQLANGIPCVPFYDNKDDQQLPLLNSYLFSLQHKDILATNRKQFKMHCYVKHQDPDKVVEEIFPASAKVSDSLD